MLALLGSLSVLVGLVASLWLLRAGIRAARRDASGGTGRSLLQPARWLLAGGGLAMWALEAALLGNDFSIGYVANHHSRLTPFPFNVATAWAALEGSIVLWGLVLAVFIWRAARREAVAPDRLGAGALAVMGAVALFFFGLMATIANPFEVCVEAAESSCLATSPWPWAAASAPIDGLGPNPLLQNHLLMAIHPPMLYLGYVGMTVPFAYAISALALSAPGTEWLKRSRRSTLVAWSFLTIGITLGGWWAYQVLSWGGYWAWDPVENASFMPWLVTTAFLHSALVQIRRGMLSAWNFVLVISSFSLTILGTFLTRSGTITSVHSFTQSAIGPTLLAFLVLVLGGSFWLLASRADRVASAPRLESMISREGAFLVNNLLLTVYAAVVLTGTIYPLVAEAVTGTPIGVARPFFDRLAVPLSFALLLVMGFGPAMPWRLARPSLVWERIRVPLQVAVLAGAATVVFSSRLGYVVGAVVAGVFVTGVIVRQLWVGARRLGRVRGESAVRHLRTVLANDPGFWGGQLAHLGVVLVAVGIAFAANLSDHTEVTLEPGESVNFAGYEIEYRSGFQQRLPNRLAVGARLSVSEGQTIIGELAPVLNNYDRRGMVITSPALLTRVGGDLYVTLMAIDSTSVRLQLNTSPLQWLVWVGGLISAAGGSWAWWGRKFATNRQEPALVG